MARKLHFFREQMTKAGVSPSETPTVRCHLDFDDLEIRLGNLEAELIEVNANSEKLQQTYKELQEYMLVLRKMENPLMGWTSTGDPYANVGEAGLEFDSEEAAKAFAEKLGWLEGGMHPQKDKHMSLICECRGASNPF